METSAKEDKNVQELFTQLAGSILGLVEQHRAPPTIPGMGLRQEESEKVEDKKKCC